MLTQAALIPMDRRTHLIPQGAEAIDLEFLFTEETNSSAIVIGDSREVLKLIPDQVFQTCVTSPPYWSLRDYNIDGQIGLEESIQDYIQSLVGVFAQVHRTLRDDGTLWLNIGDSYTSGGELGERLTRRTRHVP
jgi:DNA modification methylase